MNKIDYRSEAYPICQVSQHPTREDCQREALQSFFRLGVGIKPNNPDQHSEREQQERQVISLKEAERRATIGAMRDLEDRRERRDRRPTFTECQIFGYKCFGDLIDSADADGEG